MQEKNS